MEAQFGDARLEELSILSEIDRLGTLTVYSDMPRPLQDLIFFLVEREYVSEPAGVSWSKDESEVNFRAGWGELKRDIDHAKLRLLGRVLQKRVLQLALTHAGRVRLSELKQAIRTGREREPLGILWDARHWEQDVQIAVLEAGETSPLALAYLDMNGLKNINDTLGHDAGDLALRTYFQAVASVLGDRGQAYRLSGGADEVLVAFPDRDQAAAVKIIKLACEKLMSERLWPADPNALLSIAAGVVICTDPSASPATLRAAADEEQKKAKLRSKQTTPRPSVIAVGGVKEMIVIPHGSREKSRST